MSNFFISKVCEADGVVGTNIQTVNFQIYAVNTPTYYRPNRTVRIRAIASGLRYSSRRMTLGDLNHR